MSTRADFTAVDGFFAGEDKGLIFTITDALGATVNITGWTIQFRMAATNSGTAVLVRSAALTTPGSGICTVQISSTDTLNLIPGVWFYDLRRIDSGARAELAFGTVDLLDPFTDG